jgi:hypothetical protein
MGERASARSPAFGENNMETNYIEEETPGGVPIKVWTRGVPVEEEARRQLTNAARLPIVFRHIAAMPDVHFGIGATVGSVIPTLKPSRAFAMRAPFLFGRFPRQKPQLNR